MRGAVSPPFPLVSLLFSVSYPQASRSYYLFFTTCSLLLECLGVAAEILGSNLGVAAENLRMVSRCCSVDTPPESQETVDNRLSARIALDGSASLGR